MFFSIKIQKNYFQFKSAFEYALNKGYIHENSMYEIIKPKSKKEDKICCALEVDEQQRLTDYLLNVDTKKCALQKCTFNSIIYGTSCRRNSCIAS